MESTLRTSCRLRLPFDVMQVRFLIEQVRWLANQRPSAAAYRSSNSRGPRGDGGLSGFGVDRGGAIGGGRGVGRGGGGGGGG